MDKKIIDLFEKMKSKNLFWCYANDITAAEVGMDILAETVLKYGDVEDIRVLFQCVKYDALFDIWVRRVVFDRRFEKLNFYLARIFFNVDLETVRRERAGDDRRNKLEQLASQD
jgi:hypothetical protein